MFADLVPVESASQDANKRRLLQLVTVGIRLCPFRLDRFVRKFARTRCGRVCSECSA